MLATCARTGLKFEAASKRVRNHPLVSEILTRANARGCYQDVAAVCAEISAQGITELDIAAAMLEAAFDGGVVAARVRRVEYHAAKLDRREMRRQAYRSEADAELEDEQNAREGLYSHAY